MKGRSATEAVLRIASRAQRYPVKRGLLGCGFGDIKGGFQNISKEDLVREWEKSEDRKRWILHVKKLF